jgi:predicted AlkP superfamily phosphohydrolase/phosphomutase
MRRLVSSVASPALATRLRQQFGASAQVNWSKTRAFLLPTDRNSYLRINLKGREPSGIVNSGSEHEQLLSFIEKEFYALKNGETGKPAVEEVFRVQEIYPGENSQDLPDIAILWRSESPINVLESPTIGRIELKACEQRSGNHRPEGFLLARGPAFRAGAMQVQGDVMQVAPTLLALHGIPVPAEYEMGPLTEILATGPACKADKARTAPTGEQSQPA